MAPVLVTPAEQIDTVGEQSMGVQITAQNASSYEAENLPDGFRVNSETGKITGTGTAEQTRAVKVTAKGTSGETSAEFIWKVVPDVAAISLPDQTSRKNEPIHLKLEVPGAVEYVAEGLPPGLTINESTGEVTGAPTTFGNYDVTVKVKNGAAANERGNLAIAWGAKSSASLAGGYYSEAGAISVPEYVRGIQEVVQVDAGSHQIYGLKANGSLWAAGSSTSGQLGKGSNRYNGLIPTAIEPLEVPLLENKVTAFSAASSGVFCLMEDKTVKAWGPNQGQLGIGEDGGGIAKWRPLTVEASAGVPLANVKMLAAGHFNCVFIKTNNTLYRSGQKNLQSSFSYAEHIAAFDGLPEITAVANTFENTLLLLADGTIRIKGRNQYGQLSTGKDETEEKAEGKSSAEIVAQLIKPTLPEKAIAITLGEFNPYILLESGKVMTCGRNNRGQLANGEIGSELYSTKLTVIEGLEDVIALSAGGPLGQAGAVGTQFAVALLKNQTIMAWGGNDDGECGDGTTATKLKPVNVLGNFTKVNQISCGENHSAAIVENPDARAKPCLEAIPKNKAIQVTWRNMPTNIPRTEKWEFKYRRTENNPETGKPEGLKFLPIATKGETEESYELTGFPLAKPAGTPEWLVPGNNIEIQVVSRYKPAKPAASVSEQAGKKYRITWDGTEPGGAGLQEPGWKLEWRRTETYIPKGGGAPKQEPFNEIFGDQEVAAPGGEYITPELENFDTKGGTPATLTGTAIEVEIEGTYNDLWRNRVIWCTPFDGSGNLEAEIPQEVEPPWLTNAVVKVGEKLKIEKASEWTNNPTSITKQWYRRGTEEKDANEEIAGQTGAEYKVEAADLGKQIRIAEKAANATGESNSVAFSNGTRLVVA